MGATGSSSGRSRQRRSGAGGYTAEANDVTSNRLPIRASSKAIDSVSSSNADSDGIPTQADGQDEVINTAADLKAYLANVQFKMVEESAPLVYCLNALNHVLNLKNISDVLDNECKELARDIWLHIKGKGFQVKTPPILFEGAGN